MDYKSKISLKKNLNNNILNGNDIYSYQNTNYVLSEYQQELIALNKEIEEGEKNIKKKLILINAQENQKIKSNIEKDNNDNHLFLEQKYTQKINYVPKQDKVINKKIIKNVKKQNNKELNGIQKSEPNLYKSKSININKKNNFKINENIFGDFSNISEIKKEDNSFEDQNINPDFNIECFSQEKNLLNDKIYTKLFDFKNSIVIQKDNKDIPSNKKLEIQKIVNEYPDIIYTEIYKSFSRYKNLIKENNLLKNKIKKLELELKEKNRLIDEFTELFNQSRIKFEKLILKNKKNIKEIENNKNIEIIKLSEKIKKLEEENNVLNKRNNNLINKIYKYQKCIKNDDNKFCQIQKLNNTNNNSNNTTINKFNKASNKINKISSNVVTTRVSSTMLNSRINRYHNNYSKEIKSFFDNKENITEQNNNGKCIDYTLIIQHQKKKSNNIEKNDLIINNISKIGVESNLRKEKAIFRDLSANIERKKSRDTTRKKENSVRVLKTINGNIHNTDIINNY